jgi:hypothetical protein
VIPTAADDYTVLRTGERTKTPYPDVQFLIKSNEYHNGIFCAYSNRRNRETVDGKLVGELSLPKTPSVNSFLLYFINRSPLQASDILEKGSVVLGAANSRNSSSSGRTRAEHRIR